MTGNRCKTRVRFQTFKPEGHRTQRIKRGGKVAQDHMDHAFDKIAFNCCIRTPFNTHGSGATAPAQQHVNDGINQGRVNGQKTIVVPFFRLEHTQHCRQRDRVKVIPKTQRQDVIKRHFNVVRCEVTKRRRHHTYEAVKHHLKHRQTFISHHR